MHRIKLFEDMMDGDFTPKKSKSELLRKDRKSKIDKFDTYFINLKILKGYIDLLEKSYEINKIMLTYAIILHNFIIVERQFSDLINGAGYPINKHLDITKSTSTYWINRKLVELYDPEHIVRNNVESIERLKVVDEFFSNNPEIYTRVFTEDEIDILIQTNKYNI